MTSGLRAGVLTLVLGSAGAAAAAAGPVPTPSPYSVLPSRIAAPAPLDAAPACLPDPAAAAPAAIRQARAAAPGDERAAARLALEALAAGAQPAEAVCAQLELARLDLLEDRLPEAGARLARAERHAPGSPAATFYRAELLHRSGRTDEAALLYRRLAETGPDVEPRLESLRRAAALRRLEARAGTPEGFAAFAAALEEAEAFGADPARWGAPVAELAIAAGDLEGARRWLGRAREGSADSTRAALLAVRSADVHWALGARQEAASVLQGLVGRHGDRPVGALAGVRRVHLGLVGSDDREARRRLERTAHGGHHGLASYARGVLVPLLRRAGELDAGLDLLVKLASDARADELAPDLAGETDALLLAVTASDQSCDDVLRRLGGRRSLLLRRAGMADPFLRLGDCLLDAGFAGPALDLYRAVARRFGAEMAPRVSLRSARAAFLSGQWEAARAPAEAQLRRAARGGEVPQLGAWTLLLASIEAERQSPERAVALLQPALEEARLDRADRPEALRLLAHSALAAGGADPELRALLRSGLAVTPAAGSAGDARRRNEARLHAADLHRAVGARAEARALYAAAAAGLGPGPLQARALYWQGALAVDLDAARQAWRGARDVAERGGAWSQLASEELAAVALREAVGERRRTDGGTP